MRFLKRTTVNPRDPRDYRLYVDVTSDIVMGGRASLQLPKGTTSDRSLTVDDGMIRYNTTTDEVEVRQSGTWRALRFKEASKIIQQPLGTGDGASTLYKLNSEYNPSNVSSNVPGSGGLPLGQFVGQNIIVLIENVFQVAGTNYNIAQNPTPTLTSSGTNLLGTTTITVVPTNNASTNFTDTIPNIKAGASLSATVLGNQVFAPGTTVQTIGTNSFTINNPTIYAMPAGTTITLTLDSGYYVEFLSAATLNKPLTVLHGFDK